MRVTLSNKEHPEFGDVVISLPIPDEKYDVYMEALERIWIGDIRFHDCYVTEIQSGPPSLDCLKGTLVNVDELDFLARSIDRYTDVEMAQFQCVVATKEYWDVDTLINLSFCCDQVTVITNFSNLESIGKNHYLAQHGVVPVGTWEKLNGREIACSLIADCEGRITPYGVLYDNCLHIEPIYLGRSFPLYWDKDYLLQADYETPLEGTVSILLPQPEQRLIRLLERAGVPKGEGADIAHISGDFPDSVLDRVIRHPEDIFEINRLCVSMQKLDEEQVKKFNAVI